MVDLFDKHDHGSLVALLEGHGVRFKRNVCLCPFHDDHTPSAGVYQSKDDGAWRFKCQACGYHGDYYDVKQKLERKDLKQVLTEERPVQFKPQPKNLFPTWEALVAATSHVTDVYRYTNPETLKIELVVIRREPPGEKKRFIQAHETTGGWIMEGPPKPWPLYNRGRVRNAQKVIVVEGEKVVHALHSLDVVATTSPGGAGKASYVDWSPLAGKEVVLWRDNDDPGISHMDEVKTILQRLVPAPVLRIVDVAALNLPPKGDAFDFLAEMKGANDEMKRRAVDEVCADALQATGVSTKIDQFIEDVKSGRRKSVKFPWHVITRKSRALMPGTITLVCGDPGSSKSFFALEAAWHWHEEGTKVALFELEEDEEYWIKRALSQKTSMSGITDIDWVAENMDLFEKVHNEYRNFEDGFGQRIWCVPNDAPSLDYLAGWVIDRAREGTRIIIIDPITAAMGTAKPWVDDLNFLMKIKPVVRDCGASVILVTHPKQNRNGKRGLEFMAGSAAFARFAQSAFWLSQVPDGGKLYTVANKNGQEMLECNRLLDIFKARNGPGTGLSIGYWFDCGSLRFDERGMIMKAK